MSTLVCVFNPTTKLIDVVAGVSSYTPDPANAGLPVVLNSDGTLDGSFTSVALTAVASIDLQAGDLVNVYYSNSGVVGIGVYAQLADASANLPAVGYVTNTASIGDTVNVYTQGLVSEFFSSGFTPNDVGAILYLSSDNPGQPTKTKPSYPNLIQVIGFISQVTGTTNGYLEYLFSPSEITTTSFSDLIGTATPEQLPVATSSSLGIVSPDNTSITITDGVISASGTAISAMSEAPSGTIPGFTYTLSYTPSVMLGLFVNGIFQMPSTDYSLDENIITLEESTAPTDSIFSVYLK